MNIQKKKDPRTGKAFTRKLADIPGGVALCTADFTQSAVSEGTVIGKPDTNGLCHIVKTAKLTAAASSSTTTYTVAKGHNFKAGEVIMLATGAKAYTIQTIATNSSDPNSDDITVNTTLGKAGAVGDVLMQANSETASTSAFKHAPYAMIGDSYDVTQGENLFVNAWTIGQVKRSCIPAIAPAMETALSGIRVIEL